MIPLSNNSEKNDEEELRRLEEEVNGLDDLHKSLSDKTMGLEKRTEKLEQQLVQRYHILKELEQENVILGKLRESLDDKTEKLEESSQKLQKKLSEATHKSIESEQEKIILGKITKSETSKKKSAQRRYYAALVVAAIIIVAVFGTFYYYETLKNAERERILSSPAKGKFLIKDLKGEAVTGSSSWNMVKGDTLFISINNPKNYPKDKIDAIKNAILSEETVELDNSLIHKGMSGTSTFYKGWKGALEKASETETERYIPTKIEVLEESKEAHINIELSDDQDADGNSGYTNSVVDQNQMLLATIKIYLVKDLTDDRLTGIVRHEFGHALGLPHSTDPEDLMAPVTATNYPFVSSCDINTIISLYDNKPISQIVCEK